MKIKKIIIFIIAMLVIFSYPTSYAANDSIPAANASASKIVNYVKNNGAKKVKSIDKLIKWYKTCSKNNNNKIAEEIKDAIRLKGADDIKSYVKDLSENEIKSKLQDINGYEEILTTWESTLKAGNYTGMATKVESAKDTGTNKGGVTDPTQNQDTYKPGSASSSKIQVKVGPILGIIRNIGIVLSVIFLMIIGVQAMLGSAEERADYKKRLPKYLIGVVVLLAGSVIPQLIYNVMK